MPSNGQQPEPRPVTVAVGKDKAAFRVRPSLLRVAPRYGEGQSFRLENETSFQIKARFPEGLVLDESGKAVEWVPVAPKGAVTLQVNLDYDPSKAVVLRDYEVNVEITSELLLEGVGSSRPEIEIRR